MIHNISLPPGEFGGPWIDDLFMGTLDPEAHPYFREIGGPRVSAHYLIRRDGSLIQYVPEDKRAWHDEWARTAVIQRRLFYRPPIAPPPLPPAAPLE